jgi:hypothetical protein
MIKLFWLGLLAVFLLSGCGWNGTPTRHNDFAPLTSIEVTAVSSTIAANTSTRLSVIGHYSGVFTRDITDQATWVSGSPTVADFTAGVPDRVKGLTVGTAILTATVGSLKADYTMTVSSTTIKTMTVTPVNPSVASGLTTQLAVTGTFVDNTTQDLTFDATWTADASGFASVSDVAASKGLAKGLAVGVATITATFGGTPGPAQLNVTAPVLQSIAVTPANTSIAGFSKTAQFTATGTFSAGVPQDITSSVTWASSQPGIATIATSGLATTVAEGTTSISATVGSVTGRTNLIVTALVLNPNGLQITPVSPISLGFGNTQQLTVTAAFTNGTTQNVSASSAWISSVPTVASVSNTGLVTGFAAGSTTITASFGGQSILVTVNVP